MPVKLKGRQARLKFIKKRQMPEKIKKHGKIVLALGLILVLSAMYFIIPVSQANQISSRKVTISDSRAQATSVYYDFQGTTQATTVKCIRMRFCQESDSSGSCTLPTGMVTTGAAIYDTSPYQWNVFTSTNWAVDGGSSNGDLKLTYATGENGGSDSSWAVSGITNPSTNEVTSYVWINTYNNVDCSTSPVDNGVVTFATITSTGIGVTATVPETLTVAISDYAIGFGSLSNTNIRYATANEAGDTSEQANGSPTQLTISSNAGATSVIIKDVGNGSGSAGMYSTAAAKLIPAVASTAVSADTEEYGVYGKNSSNLTIDEAFDNDSNADGAIDTVGKTFATASAAISNAYVDIQPLMARTGSTPAGTYNDTLIVTVIPTY